MPTITINNTEYELDDLSDELKAELSMLSDVDRRLKDNEAERAVLLTAKNAYSRRVEELLPQTNN